MKTKKSILIGGLLVALLVIGVVGATNAYAQTPTNIPLHQGGPGDGRGRGLGQAELEAAAKVLGLTTDDLSTALQGGKTLEQLAQDASVDLQDVQDAIQAAHAAEMRTRIQQAVTDGTITQANADWLLEGLDKGFIGVPGAFGFGHGFGGPHGPGNGTGDTQRPPTQQQPPAQPTQQSSG
jgi:hypothetical protein